MHVGTIRSATRSSLPMMVENSMTKRAAYRGTRSRPYATSVSSLRVLGGRASASCIQASLLTCLRRFIGLCGGSHQVKVRGGSGSKIRGTCSLHVELHSNTSPEYRFHRLQRTTMSPRGSIAVYHMPLAQVMSHMLHFVISRAVSVWDITVNNEHCEGCVRPV
ncbi:hypothetical protein OBBRIDRAFT_89438 [Obba rivulosa]|uniref:Uncharacterized protein n=1 Tax=Obba rivulosa TaxID=1052685 RepID=A0A8E2APB2_9APHY|nr:hypothetical protein OBBRIDRAFT_89438 [Obba rivulosa]